MPRRTRRQKLNAHHPFQVSWEPNKAHVNRETKIDSEAKLALTTAKKDILKSLVLASLILGMEVVLYLGWPRLGVIEKILP
jgi:hypothetical protein